MLRTALASGLARKIRDSAWRGSRLLILAYHGVSTLDEHEWNPELYLPAHAMRGRLELLRDEGYNVVPLKEGVDRLEAGTLPPRAVALTFDDGTHDFHRVVVPMLREFGFPATVYVTSYYSAKEVPVFQIATQYLLWRGRAQVISGEGLVAQKDARLDLRSAADRYAAAFAIDDYIRGSEGGVDRGAAALRLIAERVGTDFDEFLRGRRLQIMTAEELQSLPQDLVDVQLHTHRHRVPIDRALFLRELEDNRRYLAPLRGGRVMDGFCYPSGITNEQFLPWLREAGVRLATTCVPGLASAKSDPLMLPRLVDSWLVSQPEFEGWLTGVAELFPRRPSEAVAID